MVGESLAPQFLEKFKFFAGNVKDIGDGFITLKVYDEDTMGMDDFMGLVKLRLFDIPQHNEAVRPACRSTDPVLVYS